MSRLWILALALFIGGISIHTSGFPSGKLLTMAGEGLLLGLLIRAVGRFLRGKSGSLGRRMDGGA